MMAPVKYFSLAVIAAFFVSCSTSKQTTNSGTGAESTMPVDSVDTSITESTTADSLPPYRPSETRTWDLLHVALDLSFDWPNENVIGTANLKLTPLFYPQQELVIDADKFKVKSVSLFGKPFSDFTNDSNTIRLHLPRIFKKGEEVLVGIQYVAHPQLSELTEGSPVSSNKGLFFIDPQDSIPGLPQQIWTQGETTYNHKWYPTLDQPNERMTQEVALTVSDTMMTLSNGILVSSMPLGNGLRKDSWKLDLPHAPYLTMIAVGQWDKVSDYWHGKPVDYYVDRGYGKDAKAIFANTPEMIEFFSTKLDYAFPWPKYSQIIVKDFVTGAEENTSATVFGDFIQFHKEDMIADGSNDYIVSHELFHHWFGDLVTCESWANITLNEGFANYAEYLWAEYKYGREKADLARMNELSGYFDQAERDAHPLIYEHYKVEENVFDDHSYNKGGLVLHMLRDLVGDEAFFASLHHYLQEHQFTSVETDDLRQAFEVTTGLDLHWFFQQWFYGTGHPEIVIEHQYNKQDKKLTISFRQTQGEKEFTDFFRLPIDLAIYKQDSSVLQKRVWLEQKTQSFTFDVPNQPLAVIVDPRDILLAVVHHDISPDEYPIRGLLAPSIVHRISAIRLMTTMEDSYLHRIMRDSSWLVRGMAVQYLSDNHNADQLAVMAQAEKDIELQYYILESLLEIDPQKAKDYAVRLLPSATRVPLIYLGLKTVADIDVDEAIRLSNNFKTLEADAIYAIRATILSKKEHTLTLDYFKTPEAGAISENYLEELIAAFAHYLQSETPEVQDQGLRWISSDFFLTGPTPQFRLYFLVMGVLNEYNAESPGPYKTRLKETIRNLYSKVSDEYIKGVLKEGLGDLVE